MQFKEMIAGNSAPKDDGSGYVYLIDCGDKIKIGKSINPALRTNFVCAIEKQVPLSIYVSDPIHEYSILEEILLSEFSFCQIKGEWFSVSCQSVIEFAKAIKAYKKPSVKSGSTCHARTSKSAANRAKEMTKEINKERKKAKKEPLSQSQLIALAIENLTIEMGVSK